MEACASGYIAGKRQGGVKLSPDFILIKEENYKETS